MYDMYRWNENARRGDDRGSAAAESGRRPQSADRRERRESDGAGVRAVQYALDRRDNGGDASGLRDR